MFTNMMDECITIDFMCGFVFRPFELSLQPWLELFIEFDLWAYDLNSTAAVFEPVIK